MAQIFCLLNTAQVALFIFLMSEIKEVVRNLFVTPSLCNIPKNIIKKMLQRCYNYLNVKKGSKGHNAMHSLGRTYQATISSVWGNVKINHNALKPSKGVDRVPNLNLSVCLIILKKITNNTKWWCLCRLAVEGRRSCLSTKQRTMPLRVRLMKSGPAMLSLSLQNWRLKTAQKFSSQVRYCYYSLFGLFLS